MDDILLRQKVGTLAAAPQEGRAAEGAAVGDAPAAMNRWPNSGRAR